MDNLLSTLLTLAPLAVGLGFFAILVTQLVQRNVPLGTWLVAAFLLGHGLVHIMFVAPPPTTAGDPAAEFAFHPDRSWLVTSEILTLSVLKVLVIGLVAAVVVGYGLAALATVGLVVPQDWWAILVLASSLASGALMLIALTPGLALGIAIDVVLVWIVLASTWAPGRLIPAG